jgi:hypothetical protein
VGTLNVETFVFVMGTGSRIDLFVEIHRSRFELRGG